MQPKMMAPAAPHGSEGGQVALQFRELIGERSWEHWFQNQTRFEVQEGELLVSVPSPFLLKWVQKQFLGALREAAASVLGCAALVRLEVAASPRGTSAGLLPSVMLKLADAVAPRERSSAAVSHHSDTIQVPAQRPAIRSACATHASSSETLFAGEETSVAETVRGGTTVSAAALPTPRTGGRRFADLCDFVVGPCNELAVAATRQVAAALGEINPLFVFGTAGNGKSHLLEGIYRQVRRSQPALQVLYLTAEQFTNFFTQALREHTLPAFRQRFRNVDVLLVDDIDFLDGKRVVQEEFLHTFKQLEGHGRQIVLAADRHPRLLSKISEELRTRFLSGIVCRLEAPDLETRRKILARKAARLEGEFTPEALEYIATRFTQNVREIEGALQCLKTVHCMTGKRVGVTAARQVLSDLERDCIRVVRLADVERAVCTLFGLGDDELRSSKKTRSLSQPRMLAMYLARKHTRAAYGEIGAYFGGRNHSTVIAAENKISEWLASPAPIRIATRLWEPAEVVEAIEQQLLAC